MLPEYFKGVPLLCAQTRKVGSAFSSVLKRATYILFC